MNCKTFQELTPLEKSIYVGRVVIALQTSEMLYNEGLNLIEKAETMGIYKTTDVNLEHKETQFFDDLKQVG